MPKQITQAELRAVLEQYNAIAEAAAAIRQRVNEGTTMESGRYYATSDGNTDASADCLCIQRPGYLHQQKRGKGRLPMPENELIIRHIELTESDADRLSDLTAVIEYAPQDPEPVKWPETSLTEEERERIASIP